MNEKFLQQFGNELSSIRKRQGLTLEQASELMNIHMNTLSTYENHTEYLKLGKLFEILEKYNVDPDIFFKNICEYIHEKSQ